VGSPEQRVYIAPTSLSHPVRRMEGGTIKICDFGFAVPHSERDGRPVSEILLPE